MVAGLGAITPVPRFVTTDEALIIVCSSVVICYFATQLIKSKFKIDDSLDVFSVHGVGGILGNFFVAVFTSTKIGMFSGFGYADGMNMYKQLSLIFLNMMNLVIIYNKLLTLADAPVLSNTYCLG